VHRDVKPANVLLTLDEPEHAYSPISASPSAWAPTAPSRTPDSGSARSTTSRRSRSAATPSGLRRHLHARRAALPLPHRTAPLRPGDQAATLWAHLSAPPPSSQRGAHRVAGSARHRDRPRSREGSLRALLLGGRARGRLRRSRRDRGSRSRGPVASVRANGEGAPPVPPATPTVISE
jgi:serine/threonine protein kinase